jgi:hypothetical protein
MRFSLMKTTLAATLAAALFLAGCATQPKEHLAAVRAAGVSPALVHKLERWGVLSPADIIELRRRQVNDAVALRQLDRTGVDCVVDKRILKQLRKAGVSENVVEAVIHAGRQFEAQFRHPYWGDGWFGPWGYPYPYDPFFYDLGWPYPRSYYRPGPGGPGPVGPGPGAPGGPAGPGAGSPGGPGGPGGGPGGSHGGRP